MKLKRLVSAISALAMSVSLFAGFAITADAATNMVYDRALTAWTEADLTEWVTTFDKSYKPTFTADTTDGLKLGSCVRTSYVTKTIAPTENSTLTINAVYNVGESTGNNSNYNYLNIGDSIAFRTYGQAQKAVFVVEGIEYSMGGNFVSKSNGNRASDIWNINMVIDTATKVITSVTVSGTNGTTPGSYTAENISCGADATFTSLVMGFNRSGGSVGNCALKSISIIEETKEVSTADYTINYVCEGKQIKSLSGIEVVGAVVEAESVFEVDGVRYYITAQEMPSLTVTADGENVLNVEVRVADTYTGNVVTSTGDVIGAFSVIEGDSYTYSIPKYLVDENGKVTAEADSNVFTSTVTPTASENITVNYNEYTGNPMWYSEVAGSRTYTDGKLSEGKASYEIGALREVITVKEDGMYNLTTAGFTTNTHKDNYLYIYRNSENNLISSHNAHDASINYYGIKTIENVPLLAGDKILLSAPEIQLAIDYITLEKTTDIAKIEVTAENATVRELDDYVAPGEYKFTVSPDLGYQIIEVLVNGKTVTADENGEYTAVVDADTLIVVLTEDLADVWVFENIALNEWMDTTYFYFDYKLPDGEEEITVSTYDKENPENSETASDFLARVAGANFATLSGEGKMHFALRVTPDEESGAELIGVKLENRSDIDKDNSEVEE